MTRGKEQAQQSPEEARFAREVFDLGREVAKKGEPADRFHHFGNEEKTTFLGSYQGAKYAVEYSVLHNRDGNDFHCVALQGRDLYLYLRTETTEGSLEGQEYTIETTYNDKNKNPKDVIANLVPFLDVLTNSEASVVEKKTIRRVFRLDTNEGPGSLLIEAQDEEEAAKKYLDWCEANNDFHSIMMFKTYFHYFAQSSLLA